MTARKAPVKHGSELPRYITPASIEIGDLIRVSWKVDDLEISRLARVHKRDYEGSMRVFYTAAGHEIFRWHPSHPKEVRVTLVEKMPAAPPEPLFDLATLTA